MQRQLLVVGTDEDLVEECRAAAEGLTHGPMVVHAAKDLVRAVELARNRRPDLVISEMHDVSAIKTLTAEIHSVSPETVVAAAYDTDDFPNDVWERTSQGAIFVEGLRAGVSDFLRRPISVGDLRQLVLRIGDRRLHAAASVGKTVAFISNKGGVGKSTLAVNVACRLAQHHPGEVLLIDSSLQMGVCATMLDVNPQTTLLDAARESERLDATLFRSLATPHASGLDLLPAPPNAIVAAEIDDETIARLLTLARRSYRYVVIDTFPLFDRITMSILDVADHAYVVVENVVPTVIAGARFVELMEEMEVPIERQHVIVNRYRRTPGNPTIEEVSRSLKRDVDHVIPFDQKAMTASNLGRPFAMSSNWWSRLERPLKNLVAEIEGTTETHRNGSARSSASTNGEADS